MFPIVYAALGRGFVWLNRPSGNKETADIITSQRIQLSYYLYKCSIPTQEMARNGVNGSHVNGKPQEEDIVIVSRFKGKAG